MSKNEIQELKKQVSLITLAGSKFQLENRGGEYWASCPFHGPEKTPSFAIKIKDGDEVFFCQGCAKGGDVISFIELYDHCTKGQAIEKVRALAGNVDYQEQARKVQETFHEVVVKEKATLPVSVWPPHEAALQGNAAAMAWLWDKRGIGPETAKDMRLGYRQAIHEKARLAPEDEDARDKGWIEFPRFVGDKIVAIKQRSIYKKCFVQVSGMDPKALYNVGTINALEPVFVTEGEFDTIILEQAGFRAVSIPNASTKITPDNKVVLKGAACVFLAGDNDGKVGNAAMRQLQKELSENAFIILWPGCKDANDFFHKPEFCGGDIGKFQTAVEKLMAKARSTPVEGFTSLLERLRNTGGTDAGSDPNRLHFFSSSLDRMNYSPSGSIVVIYSTYSGTGKTIFTTQAMLHEGKRGEVVVVYSPEVRDEAYLALVAAQVLGPKRGGLNRAGAITQADYAATADELDKATERGTPFTYYVGHSLPETDTDKVIDFIETTIKVTGATRFVIDTLHRIIQNAGRQSMTEAEGSVVKKLEALAVKYGTIFILIGQSNKEAEDLKEQRRDAHGNLRGSRELSDVAYGVYLLHRKRKPSVEGQEQKDLLELETEVVLKKDRGKGPGNAVVRMLYDPATSRFLELTNQQPPPGGALPQDPGPDSQWDPDNPT